MEFINKIEIQGYIGKVSSNEINGTRAYRLSVNTNKAVTSVSTSVVIETTWFSVIMWEHMINDIPQFKKGDGVHIIGRVRQQRYTTQNGDEVVAWEILADEVKLVNE